MNILLIIYSNTCYDGSVTKDENKLCNTEAQTLLPEGKSFCSNGGNTKTVVKICYHFHNGTHRNHDLVYKTNGP